MQWPQQKRLQQQQQQECRVYTTTTIDETRMKMKIHTNEKRPAGSCTTQHSAARRKKA